jgi:hypothetical protein
MGKVVKNGMWEAVKEDGRFGYRGSPGIYAHIQAIVSSPLSSLLLLTSTGQGDG